LEVNLCQKVQSSVAIRCRRVVLEPLQNQIVGGFPSVGHKVVFGTVQNRIARYFLRLLFSGRSRLWRRAGD